MEELSLKAKTIVKLLEQLDATDVNKKVNIYQIIEKLESIELKTVLPDVDDYDLENIRCEMSQKSISTTIAGLVRKGIVAKTEPNATKVDNLMKNIRSYYLI